MSSLAFGLPPGAAAPRRDGLRPGLLPTALAGTALAGTALAGTALAGTVLAGIALLVAACGSGSSAIAGSLPPSGGQ